MKTIIDVQYWEKSYNDSRKLPLTWRHKDTGEIIWEHKDGDHFVYFNNKNEYIGRYNSDTSIFYDGIVLVVLDSEVK